MANLTISHSIHLPPSFAAPQAAPPASDSFEYAVDTSSPHLHLESLVRELGRARNDLNERLTKWKDLVKDVEKDDKKNKKKKSDDGDEDEQGDEEE